MDDIKAGIYGHNVIPLFHWMIFLVGDSACQTCADGLRIYDGKYLFYKISFYFKNVRISDIKVTKYFFI